MRYTLLLVLGMISLSSFAQQGFFLQPTAGIGMANARIKDYTYPYTSTSVALVPLKPAVAFDVQATVGYQYKHLLLATGLGYMQSGYAEDITYTSVLGNPIGNGSVKQYIEHIALPMSIGYRIGNGRFSFVPVVSNIFTRNYRAREVATDLTGNRISRTAPIHSNDGFYKAYSVWARVQTDFVYMISPRLAVMLSPSVTYMLTNLEHHYVGLKYPTYHDYNLCISGGLKWYLHATGKSVPVQQGS
jgi:hypothetical protein